MIQFHIIAEVAITGIGKPDPARAIDRQIVGAVQAASFEIRADNDGLPAFPVLNHLPAATFTSVDDAVRVQHEAVGRICAFAPDADLTGGRVVAHNATVGDVGE